MPCPSGFFNTNFSHCITAATFNSGTFIHPTAAILLFVLCSVIIYELRLSKKSRILSAGLLFYHLITSLLTIGATCPQPAPDLLLQLTGHRRDNMLMVA